METQVVSAYNFWTGKYKVPPIPPSLVLFLVVTFAFFTLIEAFSYVSGNSNPEDSEFLLLDGYGGIALWGSFLALGAVGLLTFILLKWHGFIWASHAWLCGVYVCFSLTFLQTAAQLGGGYQVALIPLGGAIWHGLFSFLLRPKIAAQEVVRGPE